MVPRAIGDIRDSFGPAYEVCRMNGMGLPRILVPIEVKKHTA